MSLAGEMTPPNEGASVKLHERREPVRTQRQSFRTLTPRKCAPAH